MPLPQSLQRSISQYKRVDFRRIVTFQVPILPLPSFCDILLFNAVHNLFQKTLLSKAIR